MKQALQSLCSFRAMSVIKSNLTLVMLMVLSTGINAQVDCDEIENLGLACNGNINVALNASCEAEITLSMILSGQPYNNPAYPSLSESDFQLIITSNGTTVPATSNTMTVLDADHLGTNISAMVTITNCGSSCWGTILLEDKNGVQLDDCIDYVMTCEEWESQNSQNIYKPSFNLSCTVNSGVLTFEDDTSAVTCLNDYALSIERTWVGYDENGVFVGTCTQTINVENMDIYNVEIPKDTIFNYTAISSCDMFTDEFLDPSRTGIPVGVTCPNIKHFYLDTDFDLCGVSRKILRDWHIIDWCSGEQRVAGQIIKVIDDVPVQKTCPPSLVEYPSEVGKCTADINLDPWNLTHGIGAISDVKECSEWEIVVEYLKAEPGTTQPEGLSVYSSIGVVFEADSTFTLPMIQEGLVWVRYRFIDACGNESSLDNPINNIDRLESCYFEVEVVDVMPPTAICEGFTKVTLDFEGEIEVFAETFDDHSYDICGEIVEYQVKRLNGADCVGNGADYLYGPSVHFCCADLGDTLQVMLKVIDNTGRYSECEATVCVTEVMTNYEIFCPDDITLNCEQDYTTYNYGPITFGAMGVCGGAATIIDTTFNDENLSLCGIGTVIRTVTVELPNGQQTSCSSEIDMIQTDVLEAGDIFVQPVISRNDCGSSVGSLTPEVIGGFPTIVNAAVCVSFTMNYEDLVLTGNFYDACFKIKRTWTVIDWCTYELNNGLSGIYTFEQIIKITDDQGPLFSAGCEDVNLTATYPNCEASVSVIVTAVDNCTEASLIHYSWTVDVHNDGIGYGDNSGVGSTVTGTYPGGTHKVTVIAADACGNYSDACMFFINVSGNNPPVPICLANVVWVLDGNGEADVWASDFDLKSEGGCGSDDQLTFSFTNPDIAFTPNMHFTCDDLTNGVGENILLEVFIIDVSGAYESCIVTLQLQDSQDVCNDTYGASRIAGSVFNEQHNALNEVEVELYENTTDYMNSDMTIDGHYSFDNIPFYNGYKVKPTKEDQPLNGVSTLDLVLIQKHILGTKELDSPYKLIAADVNRSSGISAADLIQIRKLILGIHTEWPNTEEWLFIPENHQFADLAQPWDYPESNVLNTLYTIEDEINFYGVKMGDVNGSVVSTLANQGLESRSVTPFKMSTNNEILEAGEQTTVAINAASDAIIEGIQFTIEFDVEKLEFAGFQQGLLALSSGNVGLQHAHDGIITISYDDIKGIDVAKGDLLMGMEFKAIVESNAEETISINSSFTKAEAYTQDGQTQEIILETTQSIVSQGGFALLQNQPNPFNQSTDIGFILPSAGKAVLEVMTADGKVIHRQEGNYTRGLNSIYLDASKLSFNGVLLYRLEYNGYSETKKMIFIK